MGLWNCSRIFILLCFLLAACSSERVGIDPGRNSFYFPTGLAVDPIRPMLYVSNSNADLQFNGGTVEALDLGVLGSDLSKIGELVKEGKLD
ncbi:MAG: hypothetical protein V1754_12820, partial [Pseudomonadota bacterium]